MKQKIIYLTIPVVLILGIAAQSGFAQGLLGKRNIGFAIGRMRPGDKDFFDDSIFELGGGINIPVHPNVDATFSLSYGKAEGDAGLIDSEGNYLVIDLETTAKAFLVGMNYHFTLKEKVNPFVGIAAGLVKREVEASYRGYKYYDEDEEDPIIAVGGGVEVALNESLAVRPSITYQKIDSYDDFIAGIGLSLWFNESVFGNLSASYAFDDGDVAYSVGMGFGF